MGSYYNTSVAATLKDLDSSEHGIAGVEAEERLRVYGRNTIKVTGTPLWRKIVEPFANVFILVLFVAAAISLYHNETLDAVIIIVIMAVSAIIYYVQQFSTERIMRSLSRHQAQNVEVLRDGKSESIDAELLVPGDVIILNEGEKVPADARLMSIDGSLRVDESMLTGESEPISKQTEPLRGEKETYECTNLLFQGSFVVAGSARMVVTHTGNNTQFGQIAALAARPSGNSPVQQKIDKLITQIIVVVGAMAIVAFGLAQLRGMEITETIRFVLALSVSAVPESLPIAISVVLVLGMRRMAARKALVRNMRAIETVGVITTIATDKTGTLTKNKLTVGKVWQPPHSRHSIDDYIQKSINHNGGKAHDPLDAAFIDYINGKKLPALRDEAVATLPFDQAFAMSGNIWHHGANMTLDVKGAPEHVLQRSDMTANEHEKAQLELHQLTGEGYRVIALATATIGKGVKKFSDLPKKTKFDFVGFVAVSDVLRPEAKGAVSAALSAGVTVRMITGDHAETAYHIARQLGMASSRDQVFDARHMNVMSDDELDRAIRDVRVFARVVPEHKYRILALLKRHNITAMTGDGVNDVPALSNAHVGVAMGSGSHIAKDAGDIILLDDNFKSIIDAMREGRVIIANIRRMLYYLLATSMGEAMTMMGSLIVGLPLPLVPVQILWVNLVTDSALVIPLGLEPGESHLMKQRPKRPNSPILNKFFITRMIIAALGMTTTVLTLYAMFLNSHDEAYARTIAFSALVVMQWSNALNARSDYQSLMTRLAVWNGPFYFGLAVAFGLQMLVLFGPLGPVLHVSPVHTSDLIATGLIAFFIPIVLVEIHKFIGRRLHKKSV